ncbi:MAG: CDP-diacylglycerol--glycerol-3-phosphate 3-phosphatidyltransferase [Verrucomicrobiia bacterium]
MNLPNRLTLARIVLTVVFVVALLLPASGVVQSVFPWGKSAALFVFIIASLTDLWDGRIARQRKQETSFGALLDPVADKILTTAAFICFVEQKDYRGASLVQAWMVLLIVAREFAVTGLRLVAREQGVVLKADRHGKQKTASQMVAIILVLIGLAAREDWHSLGFNPGRFDHVFSIVVFWVMLLTAVLTTLSGIAYLYKNRNLFLQHA